MIVGIISDIHQDSDENREILNTVLTNILKHDAVGLLMAGDIGDYHNARVKAFDDIITTFPNEYRKNLALMLGNHDVRTGRQPDGSLDPDLIELYHSYLQKCNIPYNKETMCVDVCIGGYHFLCLNTDFGLKDQMELNNNSILWLKEKLAEIADPNKPTFIMTHQPFNSTHWRAGLFGGFGPQDEELKDIFLNYPQIVILNGHIHNGFGVIEFIQRPYGTLVEIPSLVKTENGFSKKGTGYLLNVSDDKLVFEAWDFNENIHLSDYDRTIYLPTLSMLTKYLPYNNENKNLLIDANNLMNKRYTNDIPSGNNTYRSQEYYGLDKIYNDKTWEEINKLREKISKVQDEVEYYYLEFKNGESISEDMLIAALNAHDYININIYDGHWVSYITMPQPQKTEQCIKIKSDAGYKTTIKMQSEDVILSRGDELFFYSENSWVNSLK